jgi:hypothetical protein
MSADREFTDAELLEKMAASPTAGRRTSPNAINHQPTDGCYRASEHIGTCPACLAVINAIVNERVVAILTAFGQQPHTRTAN